VFERIKRYAKEEMLSEIQEWDFGGRKGEIEGFRYRMEDALKAVTTKRVQEARRDEVRRELLNSEKLKVSSSRSVTPHEISLALSHSGSFRCQSFGFLLSET
jgi:hypothetical protein